MTLDICPPPFNYVNEWRKFHPQNKNKYLQKYLKYKHKYLQLK